MARILWLLPDPTGAHQPGGVDPSKATFVSLAAMAKRPQPLPGTATTWRAEVPRGGCRRLADRVLAHVRTPGGPTGPAQPVFRRPRSPPPLCSCSSLTRSNRRGTDPYARWCGRGGTARGPPIPIFGASSSFERAVWPRPGRPLARPRGGDAGASNPRDPGCCPSRSQSGQQPTAQSQEPVPALSHDPRSTAPLGTAADHLSAAACPRRSVPRCLLPEHGERFLKQKTFLAGDHR